MRIIVFRRNLAIVLLLLCWLTMYYVSKSLFKMNYKKVSLKLRPSNSSCSCRQNEEINLNEIDSVTYQVSIVSIDKKDKNNTTTRKYLIGKREFNKLVHTCGSFTSLRRGQHQRVVSYSLFGAHHHRNKFFSDRIKMIAQQIKQLYPGWLMRIYHDGSIDRSFVCQLECLVDQRGRLADMVDFCDLTKLTVNVSEHVLRPVEYMLPRMWRFLAVGDSFVDLVLSRDSESFVVEREVDAVQAWLQSDKLFHVMRDHPAHESIILEGMWGIKSASDRHISRRIFHLVTNPHVIKRLANAGQLQSKSKNN